MTTITKSTFGRLPDGREVHAFTFTDGERKMKVLSLGGILQSLVLPDKDGIGRDVLLGYDTVDGYLLNGGYLSALIGRFGNRIDKGRLTIDGGTYELYCNDRGNHLHGGKEGFDKKIWDAEIDGERLVLSCLSPDGEENYPGNLKVTVVYTFRNGELGIEYTAVSDKKTAVNLTNHAYFNLSGESDRCTILDHELTIDAPYIAPTDAELIPRGEFRPVENTPFDFRFPKTVGKDDGARATDRDMAFGGGYDHCFVFDKNRDRTKPYATLFSAKSGIEMHCFTDMPSVQFYAGNGLDQYGKGGHYYGRCGGLCLETQAIPNNVNVPAYAAYGSSIVDAGEIYRYTAKYSFGIRK